VKNVGFVFKWGLNCSSQPDIAIPRNNLMFSDYYLERFNKHIDEFTNKQKLSKSKCYWSRKCV